MLAVLQPKMLRLITSGLPTLLGERRSETLHEQERDQDDDQEDQHRYRGADAEVQLDQELVEVEHRHALEVRVVPGGDDVDGIEDPEGVERAEQQRYEDRRLHQRARYAPEPLPGPRALP